MAIVNAGSNQADLEDEIARLERMLPALLRPGRHAPRPGDPEPGRGVGADGRHRPAARRRRLRRARARAVAAQADAVAARVRRRRVGVGGRREPARRTCAGRRCSTTSSSPRPTSRGWPRRRARSSAPAGAGSRSTRPTSQAAADALAERADTTQLSGAEMLRLALGLEGSPLAGGISVDGGGWAADLLAAAADVSADAGRRARRASSASCAATRPRRSRGSASSTRPASAAASRSTWVSARRRRCSPTCSPAPATGPALVIAPPAVVGNWTAEAARFTPGLRVVVHHGANRAAADEIAAEVADADVVDHHLRHRGARRRRDRRGRRGRGSILDEAQAIKNPANDTSQQLRRIPARSRDRAHRHADRERPRRPLGDPRLHQPRARRPAAAVHRPRSRATATRDARRGRGRDARAQRHPRVPPHEGRARDRGRAARPDRRARPLRDDPRADRPVPGACSTRWSPAPTSPRARSRARARSSPRSPRSSRSATTRPRTSDDDRPLAGRSGKLARLEEIVDAVFAAGERVLVFTHFAEWGLRLADHLTEAHRHAGRVLPRRAVAHARATASSPTSRAARARARSCCR